MNKTSFPRAEIANRKIYYIAAIWLNTISFVLIWFKKKIDLSEMIVLIYGKRDDYCVDHIEALMHVIQIQSVWQKLCNVLLHFPLFLIVSRRFFNSLFRCHSSIIHEAFEMKEKTRFFLNWVFWSWGGLEGNVTKQ